MNALKPFTSGFFLALILWATAPGAKASIEVNLDILEQYQGPDFTDEDGNNAGSTMFPDTSPDLLRQKYLGETPKETNKPVSLTATNKKQTIVRIDIPAPAEKPASPGRLKSVKIEPAIKKPHTQAHSILPKDMPPAPPADVLAEPITDNSQAIDLTEKPTSPISAPPSGMHITSIGYIGDDIRLNDIVKKSLVDQYIPKIQKNLQNKRITIYAYASSEKRSERDTMRLSLSRALQLRSFLITSDIDPALIDMKPMGDQAEDGFKDRVDIILQ